MDGTPFGHYRLLELLGRGGMGEVWRAYDTLTDRVVALKLLPAHWAEDEMFQLRFRREAHAAAGLSEPHIVPIHNYGEIDGRLFVDMRMIEGRDLQALLNEGPLAPARAVTVIEQVAAALNAAHKAGLVHRDIKPSNILIGDLDFAYLIDFGLARAVDHTNLTETGTMIGTWPYMAPERFSLGRADPRSDTYSLACVLYECLTGSHPYPGDSVEQQVVGHLMTPPPRPSLTGNVPADFDNVIATGLAKDPERRYVTSFELALAARAAITSPTTRPVRSDLPTETAPRPSTPIKRELQSPPRPLPRAERAPQPYRQAHSHLPGDATRHRTPAAEPGRGGGRHSLLRAQVVVPALMVVGVLVVGVVIATTQLGRKPAAEPSEAPAPTTPIVTTASEKSDPTFDGTFTAAFGPATDVSGMPLPGDSQLSQTWSIKSLCRQSSCVATASLADGQSPVSSLVFDMVDGRWLAVTAVPGVNCHNGQDERWVIFSLQAKPDGSLTGEWREAFPVGACSTMRTVTFSRTGGVKGSVIDPGDQPPRVQSPAEALHGAYRYTEIFADHTHHHDYSGETYCLRDGRNCLSYLHNPEEGYPLTFAEAKWTALVSGDGPCAGGTEQIQTTSVYPLPQPPQNPITAVSGKGHRTTTGSCTATFDFDVKLERIGD